MTIGKTHTGKTTFAHLLKQQLTSAFILDQDNHAAFINKYYHELLPTDGPNILKHGLSRFIANYAKVHTDLHVIVCNANLQAHERATLLQDVFPKTDFLQILVYFDIADETLKKRIAMSDRPTDIFRGNLKTFSELLANQQKITAPSEEEADYLFVIKSDDDIQKVIQAICQLDSQ